MEYQRRGNDNVPAGPPSNSHGVGGGPQGGYQKMDQPGGYKNALGRQGSKQGTSEVLMIDQMKPRPPPGIALGQGGPHSTATAQSQRSGSTVPRQSTGMPGPGSHPHPNAPGGPIPIRRQASAQNIRESFNDNGLQPPQFSQMGGPGPQMRAQGIMIQNNNTQQMQQYGGGVQQQQPPLKLRQDQVNMSLPQLPPRIASGKGGVQNQYLQPVQSEPQNYAQSIPNGQNMSGLPPQPPSNKVRPSPARQKQKIPQKITQGPKGADESVILPGGGNLNIGQNSSHPSGTPDASRRRPDSKTGASAGQAQKVEYLNVWQQQIRQKEEAKKKEKQDKILRERMELQEQMDSNPFGKQDQKLEKIRGDGKSSKNTVVSNAQSNVGAPVQPPQWNAQIPAGPVQIEQNMGQQYQFQQPQPPVSAYGMNSVAIQPGFPQNGLYPPQNQVPNQYNNQMQFMDVGQNPGAIQGYQNNGYQQDAIIGGGMYPGAAVGVNQQQFQHQSAQHYQGNPPGQNQLVGGPPPQFGGQGGLGQQVQGNYPQVIDQKFYGLGPRQHPQMGYPNQQDIVIQHAQNQALNQQNQPFEQNQQQTNAVGNQNSKTPPLESNTPAALINKAQERTGALMQNIGAYQNDLMGNGEYVSNQKQQLQNDLMQQIQEQKQRKALELKKKKEEDDRLEAKIARERQELEDKYKDEVGEKRRKAAEIRDANAMIAGEKKKSVAIDLKKENQNQVIEANGVQIMIPKGPRNALDEIKVENQIQHDTFAEPTQPHQQQQQIAHQPQKPFKPTTSVMLQGQQQLINDMKQNFEREMASVKEQMIRQQQQFQDQMHGLIKEQQATQEEKNRTEAEMQQMRSELEDKRKAERQAQEIYQMATQRNKIPQASNEELDALELMKKYGPKNQSIEVSMGGGERWQPTEKETLMAEQATRFQAQSNQNNPQLARIKKERPPSSDVLAEQNKLFPPRPIVQSNAATTKRSSGIGNPRKIQNGGNGNRSEATIQQQPSAALNESRGSRMYSRNSDRRKEIGAYEQLFFNNGTSQQKIEESRLGSNNNQLPTVSQGHVMSYEKPVIGANKNQQMVDLRGVMGTVAQNDEGAGRVNGYQNLQQTPERHGYDSNKNYFKEQQSSGKRSMIGHSDFVHPDDQRGGLDFATNNLSRDPYLNLPESRDRPSNLRDERGGNKQLNHNSSGQALGEVSQLVLATENSANRKPPIGGQPQAAWRNEGLGNLNLSKLSLGGADKTNTMDFIEKMINQGQIDNEKYSLKKPKEIFKHTGSGNTADDSIGYLLKDFKLPEYDGIQGSIRGQKPPIPGTDPGPTESALISPEKLLNVSNGDLTRKYALATSGTNHSIGTINLDALLQKQDKRLDRIDKYAEELEANRLRTAIGAGNSDVKLLGALDESRIHNGGTNNFGKDILNLSSDSPDKLPLYGQQSKKQPKNGDQVTKNGEKDELKELDTLLFDILKS